MLYDRPIYRPLGDMFVDVEFGDELHLALNFRVIGLNLSLAGRPIPGVTETVPSNRALMIAYDSSVIRQAASSTRCASVRRKRPSSGGRLRGWSRSRSGTTTRGPTSAREPTARPTTWTTWPRSMTRRSKG